MAFARYPIADLSTQIGPSRIHVVTLNKRPEKKKNPLKDAQETGLHLSSA